MKRLVAFLFVLLALIVAPHSARAAVIDGGDMGGADLTVANGDVLNGVFTNVGTFTVPAGVLVTVQPGVPFEMHANAIVIAGTLDATGAGSGGGTGGPAASEPPSNGGGGSGPGGGGGASFDGQCVHPSGGGGGGYGGPGGAGGTPGSGDTFPGAGGAAYGSVDQLSDRPLGSGGGGGSGTTCAENHGVGGFGGAGGGSVFLDASTITISGAVTANGARGGDGGSSASGGGGGSGGTIVLSAAAELSATGTISARGGNGGNAGGALALAKGGGGGGGGRVKIFAPAYEPFVVNVCAGVGGVDGSSNFISGAVASQKGSIGTVHAPQLPISSTCPVAPETPTTTTVSSATHPSVFGQAVQLTAQVTAGATGTVIFRDGGVSIGTGTLNPDGIAMLTTSSLTVGDHAIDAVYTGDGHYGPSTAPSITQTVHKGNTTNTLISSQNPSVAGTNVTFTATVTPVAPAAGVPEGTVTFMNDGSPLGAPMPVDGSGEASITLDSLDVGNHDITAVYSGSDSFETSTSATLPQQVNLDGTLIAFASSPNPSTFGESVTLTATLTSSSGGGTPTGTVDFFDDATLLATVTIDPTGVATYTTAALHAGTHSIKVEYPGSGTHQAASATISQIVNQATTTVAVTSSANPSVFGQSVTFTATVSSPAGTPTGTVTFSDGGSALRTVALTAGTATYSTSSLSVGAHEIIATYSGTTDYAASTSALSQQVNRAQTTTALVSSSNPSGIGTPVTFTALVTPVAPGAGVPRGPLSFFDGPTLLGTSSVDAAGKGSFTTAALTAGSHSITASYAGDSSFEPSASSPLTQTVSQSAANVTVTSSSNPSTVTKSVTFTATVTGPSGTPTGSVTFTDGTKLLGTGGLVNGMTSISTSSLAVGSHVIVATYQGNASYPSGGTGTVVQVVDKAATVTTLTSSPNPSTADQPITLTATVTSSLVGISGEVEFFDGVALLGKATVAEDPLDVTQAIATFTTSALAVGTHSFTATYTGDGHHKPSATDAITHVVTPPGASPGDAGILPDAGAPPPSSSSSSSSGSTGEVTPGENINIGGGGVDGDCGCRAAGSSNTNALALLPLAGLALLLARRRRHA